MSGKKLHISYHHSKATTTVPIDAKGNAIHHLNIQPGMTTGIVQSNRCRFARKVLVPANVEIRIKIKRLTCSMFRIKVSVTGVLGSGASVQARMSFLIRLDEGILHCYSVPSSCTW